MSAVCVLCSQLVSSSAADSKSELTFCCPGCQAVYAILKAKGELDAFSKSSVFKEALQSGLISNPSLLEEVKQQKQDSFTKKRLYLEVLDMWCPSCSEVISWILLKKKGVVSCVIDYATDLAVIDYHPQLLSKEKIVSLIQSLGYRVEMFLEKEKKGKEKQALFPLMVAIFCAMNLMMLSSPLYVSLFYPETLSFRPLFTYLSFMFALPLLVFSAPSIYQRFFNGLRAGFVGMEALIVLGVSSSFFLSCWELFWGQGEVYFDSMAMIIVFVLLGKQIEGKMKFSVKKSLLTLFRLTPKKGRKRLETGKECMIPIKEFALGDFLVTLSGEKIALDGEVVEGEGVCDEAFMTGESFPCKKMRGSLVLAGSILKNGYLVTKVKKVYEETVLHQLLDLISVDLSKKTKKKSLIDGVVKGFIPVVFFVALSTLFFFWPLGPKEAVYRALTVLLISCPCAIGIAIPLAEAALIHALASFGVIVRKREVLSILGLETLFISDKTGTMTEGVFEVLKGIDHLSLEDKKQLYGLVSRSIHPISQAIKEALDGTEPFFYDKIEEVPGKGVKGFFRSQWIYLGSKKWLEEEGVDLSFLKETQDTCVIFSKESKQVPIYLGDRIKPSSKEFVKNLFPLKTLLLSGDGQGATKKVADFCLFDEWIAQASPLKKGEVIDSLQARGEVLCMIGDGVNDALALAKANVGISVVNATEMTAQVADLLLTVQDFSVILKARKLAVFGRKIIKQNLFWAFIYNVLGIPLAVLGLLSPLFAATAMAISSLMILFNSRRVGKISDF